MATWAYPPLPTEELNNRADTALVRLVLLLTWGYDAAGGPSVVGRCKNMIAFWGHSGS
jgi:hypothetical protein